MGILNDLMVTGDVNGLATNDKRKFHLTEVQKIFQEKKNYEKLKQEEKLKNLLSTIVEVNGGKDEIKKDVVFFDSLIYAILISNFDNVYNFMGCLGEIFDSDSAASKRLSTVREKLFKIHSILSIIGQEENDLFALKDLIDIIDSFEQIRYTYNRNGKENLLKK